MEDKYYKAWEVLYDYERELREQGRIQEAALLCEAGAVVMKRSNEELHRSVERERLQLRTATTTTVRHQPRTATIQPTGWAALFNANQMLPS